MGYARSIIDTTSAQAMSRKNSPRWGLKKDKKMEKGQIKFILMDGLGKSFIDNTVTDEELLLGIRAICKE